MIGQRARMRIPLGRPRLLAGTAVILALLAALLAGAPSVSAAPGDISRTHGWCIFTNSGFQVHTDESDRQSQGFGSFVKVRNANNQEVNISCPTEFHGYPVDIKANGTVNPEFTRRERGLSVTLNRPVVTPGTDVEVTVQLVNWYYWSFGGNNNSIVRSNADRVPAWLLPGSRTDQEMYETWHTFHLLIDYLTTSGSLANPPLPSGSVDSQTYRTTVPVPFGTLPGEYTIAASITASICGGENNDPRCRALAGPRHPRLLTVSDEATLTVVEALPTNPVSATLTLIPTFDNPSTGRDESRPATDTAPADGGVIWLQLDALNAEGELVHPTLLSSNRIYAPDGDIEFWWANADGSRANRASAWRAATVSSGGHSPMHIAVRKTDRQPGTVDVSAIVVGRTGLAEAEPITLTFTGPPATLSLGSGVSIGQPAANMQTQRELSLSAMDAAGNNVAAPTNAVYRVTDADGNAVSSAIIRAETSTVGASTDSTRDDTNAPAVLLTVDDTVDPGVYTVTATLPGQPDSAASATLTVAGIAANLALAADVASGTQAGQLITVTATATDAGGANVADGSEVTFSLTGASLYIVGTDANPGAAGAQRRTANGVATAQLAVVDDGSTVISATIDNQTSVLVISNAIMAEAAAEEAEPEPTGVDCLSGQSGFVSWTCSASTNASTLLAELGDSAKAIHLFNGQRWVRYSEVNGRVVPGSTDFAIFDNDVLYISN